MDNTGIEVIKERAEEDDLGTFDSIEMDYVAYAIDRHWADMSNTKFDDETLSDHKQADKAARIFLSSERIEELDLFVQRLIATGVG